MIILGIDIGGSGIKGAPVNLEQGQLAEPRYRLPTPKTSRPDKVVKTITKIAKHFEWSGPIGCGFPGIVRDGVTLSAANLNEKWVGAEAEAMIREATDCPVSVINDADAAGLAEITFGAGRDRPGVVLIVTIGTGLGTSLFINGSLVPNTELGHIELDCEDAESLASDAARKRENLSWKKWAARFDRYLGSLERLLSPDLIILGGGGSKKYPLFRKYLTIQTQTIPALLLNEAGIVGAALAARHLLSKEVAD